MAGFLLAHGVRITTSVFECLCECFVGMLKHISSCLCEGAVGVTGSPGFTGATGVTGPTGSTGNTGDVGSRGPTGAPGVKGIRGPQGQPGMSGATGTAGPTGSSGSRGASGRSHFALFTVDHTEATAVLFSALKLCRHGNLQTAAHSKILHEHYLSVCFTQTANSGRTKLGKKLHVQFIGVNVLWFKRSKVRITRCQQSHKHDAFLS